MHFGFADRQRNRWHLTLFTHVTLIGLGLATALAASLNIATRIEAAGGQARYYASTGHSVSGVFLSFFDANGGLRIFGYPISDPAFDGGRLVQYFERQRFEYHDEAAGTGNEVQLGRLGAEMVPAAALSAAAQTFQSITTGLYVAQTRHNLGAPFLNYWKSYGGLRIFGYPITEEFTERDHVVQYFERARMEYHPEYEASGNTVELGLLGTRFLAARAGESRNVAPVSRGVQPAPQEAAKPASGAPLNSKEEQLLGLINDARKAAGAQPLSLDGTLRGIALSRSTDMANRNYFSHTTPEGTDFMSMIKAANAPFKFAGEIIANNNYDEGSTTAQAFSSFMNSAHHHDIMLDPRYNIAGVGVAANGRGLYYFTVIFVQR